MGFLRVALLTGDGSPRSRMGLGVRTECVMTGNGPAYRSSDFNAMLETRGIRHRYTKPFGLRRNGKVECMNRILVQERRYAHARTPSSSAAIGIDRTAHAAACLRCRASPV